MPGLWFVVNKTKIDKVNEANTSFWSQHFQYEAIISQTRFCYFVELQIVFKNVYNHQMYIQTHIARLLF